MSTVTVSCKTPNGFLLQVGKAEQVIKGWNSNEIEVLSNVERVGFTHEVDANLWKQWLEANKETLLVKNGLVFANESANKVRAEAKERKGVKSGSEAIDPNAKQDGVEKMSGV